MRNLRGFGLLTLLFAAWTSAQAATIEVSSAKNLTVVTVAGELNFRDEEAFTDKVLRLKDAVVVIDSVGGTWSPGLRWLTQPAARTLDLDHLRMVKKPWPPPETDPA